MTPERHREYYLANRERIIARTRARKIAKAALVKEENRRWYIANRDTKLAQNAAWTAACMCRGTCNCSRQQRT